MSRRYWIPHPAEAAATLAALALHAAVWATAFDSAPVRSADVEKAGGCAPGASLPYVVVLPDGSEVLAAALVYDTGAKRVTVIADVCIFRSGFE